MNSIRYLLLALMPAMAAAQIAVTVNISGGIAQADFFGWAKAAYVLFRSYNGAGGT